MFNPVAAYQYLLPTMYFSVADIANPDLFLCGYQTWICLDIIVLPQMYLCKLIEPKNFNKYTVSRRCLSFETSLLVEIVLTLFTVLLLIKSHMNRTVSENVSDG